MANISKITVLTIALTSFIRDQPILDPISFQRYIECLVLEWNPCDLTSCRYDVDDGSANVLARVVLCQPFLWFSPLADKFAQ